MTWTAAEQAAAAERTKLARQLLLDPELSIVAIAARTGLKSASLKTTAARMRRAGRPVPDRRRFCGTYARPDRPAAPRHRDDGDPVTPAVRLAVANVYLRRFLVECRCRGGDPPGGHVALPPRRPVVHKLHAPRPARFDR